MVISYSAHIDFVQRRYWAQEGDGFKEICLMARGYDFSVQLNALEDSSTEGTLYEHMHVM